MGNIKIVLVDDHQVVRKGLKLLLSSESDFEVVGEFGSGAELLNYLQDNPSNLPNVLITDITMPNMTGLELLKEMQLKFPSIKVIMLTMHLNENYIMESIEFGAKAYLSKDSEEDDIINSIKSVNQNQLFLTKSVSDILAKSMIHKRQQKLNEDDSKLTKRELEILKCIVDGSSNKMIGANLNISERTVNAHRYNIMQKLKAKNSADLVRISIGLNLI